MADQTDFKLNVQLGLVWLHKNDYEATVSVVILNTCYHEVDLKVGLPPGVVGVPEILYLTYTFTYDTGRPCGQIVQTVKKSITIPFSNATPKVTAYAVVNGQVAGSVTKPFPR